jgi:zinc/manganese transport system substrate-binding protein
VRRTTTVLALTSLAVLALSGCGGGTGGGGDGTTTASVASADPAACPGEVLDVVVSVGQWGDVVRRLAGDCATVTTIVASGAVDPHDFAPGTADLAALSGADLVVMNGADYDHWAEDAVASQDPEPAVVSAADAAGGADEGGNPHLWYDPEVVQRTAEAVTAELTELSPDAAAYFTEQAAAWNQQLQPYLQAVDALRSVSSGRTFGATETVFDLMARAVGLTDATPEGYQRAVSNHSEPAPGDLAAFETALGDGSIDVLIYNTQTSGRLPEQLRATAAKAGVPVVEVTESPADPDGSFVAWQVDQLSALSDALSGTP